MEYKCFKELQGHLLQYNDILHFTILTTKGLMTFNYIVKPSYCQINKGLYNNSKLFDILLDLKLISNKKKYADSLYGNDSVPDRTGHWPYFKEGRYEGLTNLVLDIYKKIEGISEFKLVKIL